MNNDDAALATADKIFTNIVARVSYVVIWGCLLMRVVSLAICVSQFTPKSNGIESCTKREKNKGEKNRFTSSSLSSLLLELTPLDSLSSCFSGVLGQVLFNGNHLHLIVESISDCICGKEYSGQNSDTGDKEKRFNQ